MVLMAADRLDRWLLASGRACLTAELAPAPAWLLQILFLVVELG